MSNLRLKWSEKRIPGFCFTSPLFFFFFSLHLQLSKDKTQWKTALVPKWLLKLKPQRRMHALEKANAWKLNSNITWLAVVHRLSPYKLFIFNSSQQYFEDSSIDWWFKPWFSTYKSIQPSGLVSCSLRTCENESQEACFSQGLHLPEQKHRDLEIKMLGYLYSKVQLCKVICTETGERP